jgi:hypothetical protein
MHIYSAKEVAQVRRGKTFDCVEMKNRIQAELLKEREGMTDEEVRAEIKRRLETSNSPIAQWWRKLDGGR